MAMAAKAKLLLRELKTVRADLAFAKERCAQLEEENRVLRENRDRGDNPENDELVWIFLIIASCVVFIFQPWLFTHLQDLKESYLFGETNLLLVFYQMQFQPCTLKLV